jgi:hypothetical protein
MRLSVRLQAVFASWIPEITELVGQPNKYAGHYQINPSKKYVSPTALLALLALPLLLLTSFCLLPALYDLTFNFL